MNTAKAQVRPMTPRAQEHFRGDVSRSRLRKYQLPACCVAMTLSMAACGDAEDTQVQQLARAKHDMQQRQLAESQAAQALSIQTQQRKALHQQESLTNNAMQAASVAPMPTSVLYERGAQLMESAVITPDSPTFKAYVQNGIMVAGEIPVSTFAIDVDTGSYSTLRRMLREGQLPAKNTLRVEEMINYFDYHYPAALQKDVPFAVNTELAPSPYNDDMMLLRIGLQAYDVPKAELGASNLVFLLDVSGSMASKDKLPLLQTALGLLTEQLSASDKVSIVVYAGAAGIVLDGAAGNDTQAINFALKQLQAGGATNGEQGIVQAYQLAKKHFIAGGINRVLLATDGDFNVGLQDVDALIALVEQQQKSGIGLTTLGFGMNNYHDHLMEQLADRGNGHYAYIDSANEARKVLVDELSATLLTVAKDVKVQLEFNPALVSEYRLIGYENRALAREEFNNDKVDAGEIGAGHKVTALYELRYVDSPMQANDKLRYGYNPQTGHEKYSREEIAFLKLRYKKPDNDNSELLSVPIRQDSAHSQLAHSSEDFRFAAAVAGLGQLVNQSHHLHQFDYQELLALTRGAMGEDLFGYRHEFLQLVQTAAALDALKLE